MEDFILQTLRHAAEMAAAAAAAKSLQSCPTLCDPIDGSPPGSPVPNSPGKNTGVGCHFRLQCMKVKSLSRVRLSATPWTAAYQAPLSMGFSRQEYWSGVALPSPQNISRDTIIKLVKKKKKRIKAARKKDTCYVGKQKNCKILVRNSEILKSME